MCFYLPQSFWLKSLSEYISLTAHQKAFLFKPWVPERVSFYAMSFGPKVHASGRGKRSKSRTQLKCVFTNVFNSFGDSLSDMTQPLDSAL